MWISAASVVFVFILVFVSVPLLSLSFNKVDCIQPVPKEEPSPATKFQSIGVQVEDDWR